MLSAAYRMAAAHRNPHSGLRKASSHVAKLWVAALAAFAKGSQQMRIARLTGAALVACGINEWRIVSMDKQ